MYWSVKKVIPLQDYKLELTFENAKVKVFDMKPHLENGIFNELKNVPLFNTVSVAFDSVVWQNEADFDPKYLYKNSYEL